MAKFDSCGKETDVAF